ncbi:MAG: glycoside hydrolase family 52 protein [Fimbriimonadaceae bacterium]
MAQVHEAILGRLGSRFCLHFRPREKSIGIGAYGFHIDESTDLLLGVRVNGQVRALPFHRDMPGFPLVEQIPSATGITFVGHDYEWGLRVRFHFTSPYWPQDPDISQTPAILLQIEVEALAGNMGRRRDVEGEILVEWPGALEKDGALRKAAKPELYWRESIWYEPKHVERVPALESGMLALFPIEGDGAFSWHRWSSPFKLGPSQPKTSVRLAFAGYVDEPVLRIPGSVTRFRYTRTFRSLDDVLARVRSGWRRWMEKTASFEKLLERSSLSPAQRELLGFAFQSYLANTWWTVDESGKDWWSVWEGCCHFHSTVDVEYNLAWFYLLFEPHLLKLSFEAWATRVRDRVLAHDLGSWFQADGMDYPHEMPVEENANFLLLLHAYTRMIGDRGPLDAHWQTVKTLAEYILDADTTGNGFPAVGTANTIDDASPAVQYSKQQTYLAVKALSAYAVVEPWAEERGDRDLAARCRQGIDRINATLSDEAWLEDHYAVCLERSADGMTDLYTGERLSGELTGWDASTLYTGNGLLYMLATGVEPPIDLLRIRKDLITAAGQGRCAYGNYHSSADDSNLWVSQNLHRDFLGAYLGVDLLDRAEGYWLFELWENSTGRGGFFMDTYGANRLNFYPRGATAWGTLMALGGVRIDRSMRRLVLDPPRIPVRFPLLALADWTTGQVPTAEFWLEEGLAAGRVRTHGLLEGWEIESPFPLTVENGATPSPGPPSG